MMMNDFGCAILGSRVFEPAHELLLVIRTIISTASSPRRGGQLYDAISEEIWPEGGSVLSQRGLQYEMRNILERHRLFGMAVWLLMDWPHRFERVIRKSDICLSSLTKDARQVPNWYARQIEILRGAAGR
jgi:hypothetical protein